MTEIDLTVIITTSYVKSHPSTELIEEVIRRLPNYVMKIIIICDGYKITEKTNVKSGKILNENANDYNEYINRLIFLYPLFEIIKQTGHCGFAENVKTCLNITTTKYVMIVQHDQLFVKHVDLKNVLRCMDENPNDIKYLGFASQRNCNELKTRLISKKFRKFLIDLNEEINLYLEDNSIIIDEIDFQGTKVDLLQGCLNDEINTNKIILQYYKNKVGLNLMPLMFFYDRPHIMRTEDYINLFEEFKIKFFMEDTLGHFQLNDISMFGMEAFNKYKSFLLYDNFPDVVCTNHSSGRSFITKDEKTIQKKSTK